MTSEKLDIRVRMREFSRKKDCIPERFYSSKLLDCIRQLDIS